MKTHSFFFLDLCNALVLNSREYKYTKLSGDRCGEQMIAYTEVQIGSLIRDDMPDFSRPTWID